MKETRDDTLAELRRRATRALRGMSHEALIELSRRAITGPPPEQMSAEALAGLEALQNDVLPTEAQIAALEYAIRLFRPAPFVRDANIDPLPDETVKVFPEWADFAKKVSPFLRAIGRLDRVTPEGRPIAMGTGFLIAPTLLVTNRHVVWQLSHGGDVVRPGEATVFFRCDWNTPPEPPVPVRRVADFHPELDLAVLELEAVDRERTPLRLSAATPAVGQLVVAIGFPWDDGRNPAFVPLLFGDVFGVKRAAPGEIVARRPSSFMHDCTTLGGNSGSPVLAMDTADVVGIHADGLYLYRNEAISAVGGAPFLSSYAARPEDGGLP